MRITGDVPAGDALLTSVESKVYPADTCFMIYTSGTSSEPKGVLHSHGAFIRKAVHLSTLNDGVNGFTRTDRVFCNRPFFWIGGINSTVGPALYAGAALLCTEEVRPELVLDFMEREGATHLAAWPQIAARLPSAADRDIPALRSNTWSTVGRTHTSLGMTETIGPYTRINQDMALPPGEKTSAGSPLEHIAWRIVDPGTGAVVPDGVDGAIKLRGYPLLQGLYKKEREDTFSADGFYDTGDLGCRIGSLLFLRGRTDETRGNNVAPAEVESVLRSFPEIRDAYVQGVPDADRGAAVAALVIVAVGSTVDPTDIQDRTRAVLSNYKVPRLVIAADESQIPMLPSGKADRRAIRRLLAASYLPCA